MFTLFAQELRYVIVTLTRVECLFFFILFLERDIEILDYSPFYPPNTYQHQIGSIETFSTMFISYTTSTYMYLFYI